MSSYKLLLNNVEQNLQSGQRLNHSVTSNGAETTTQRSTKDFRGISRGIIQPFRRIMQNTVLKVEEISTSCQKKKLLSGDIELNPGPAEIPIILNYGRSQFMSFL